MMELVAGVTSGIVGFVLVWRYLERRKRRAEMVLTEKGLMAVSSKYYARELELDVLATSDGPVATEAEKARARRERWGRI